MMNEIKDIIIQHKKSPVEFSRKDMFVIASNSYKLKTVSVDQIKKYIAQSKQFLEEMENVPQESMLRMLRFVFDCSRIPGCQSCRIGRSKVSRSSPILAGTCAGLMFERTIASTAPSSSSLSGTIGMPR